MSEAKLIDDLTMTLEERMGRYIADAMASGEGPFRRALVNPVSFWGIVRRTNARVESGPYGEYVVLVVASGRLYVVPTVAVAEDRCVFEKEPA